MYFQGCKQENTISVQFWLAVPYALLDERFQSTPFHGVYMGSNPIQGTNFVIITARHSGERNLGLANYWNSPERMCKKFEVYTKW